MERSNPGGLKEAENYHGSICQWPLRFTLPQPARPAVQVDGLLLAGRCAFNDPCVAATVLQEAMGNMMATRPGRRNRGRAVAGAGT